MIDDQGDQRSIRSGPHLRRNDQRNAVTACPGIQTDTVVVLAFGWLTLNRNVFASSTRVDSSSEMEYWPPDVKKVAHTETK